MAVVSCVLNGKITGSFKAGSYTARVYYRVIVNSRNDGPQIVCSAAGLPALYSTYAYGNESNAAMLLREYEPMRIGDVATMTWEVAAVYSTPAIKEGSDGGKGGGTGKENPGQFQNPLLELPTAKFHSSSKEVLIHQIYDGRTNSWKPCTASTGEVFDPPPKKQQGIGTLTITRNEDIGTNHPAIALKYQNAVNADVFFGMKPGTWRIKEISPETHNRQIPGGSIYRFLRTAYVFEGDADGWDLSLLDYGTFYWKVDPRGTNFPLVDTKFKTADRHPCSRALDGNGGALPPRLPFTTAGSVLTVPATDPSIPYISGTKVYVDAANFNGVAGKLPAPLQKNVIYYVYAVAGTSFKLAKTANANALIISDADYLGNGMVSFTTDAPHGFVGGETVLVEDVVDSYLADAWNDEFVVLNGLNGSILTATQFSANIPNFDPFDSPFLQGVGEPPLVYQSDGFIARPISLTAAGTGLNFIWSPGTFFQVRPYSRIPFAPLGLPASFAGCQ